MLDFILRPFRRNFGKDKVFYAAIDDMFGFIPNNIELYKLALIHKSASVVTSDGRQINNERLEYLGDAVIETVTSDYLFIEYPDMNEGFLTQLRSKMVSRQTLNEVAKRIGLDDYVISHTSASMSQKHIYGDAFEAMMGAIYLDQGYDFVNRLLINKIFAKYIKADNLAEAETDFKSRLIEWCQKNHHSIRFSTHNDKSYTSSHPFFYCKVLIDNIEVGYGAGDSKKEAEQRAAYSVAQGVSDADCTKLMDRLDTLEGKQLQKNKSSEEVEKVAEQPKPTPKPMPKSQPKESVKEDVKPEPKVVEPKAEKEPKAGTEAKAEKEPKAEKPVKAENEPKEIKPTKEVKESKLDNEPKSDAVSGQKSEPTAKQNPKSRRGHTRKSEAPKTDEVVVTEPVTEQTQETAEAAETVAKKKTTRRPKAKKNVDKSDVASKPEAQNADAEKRPMERAAKPKRSRSRSKSTAEAEQSLNHIAEDVNALMAEVEKLTKESV